MMRSGFMKRLAVLAIGTTTLAWLAGCGGGDDATASLLGANEAPAVTTAATGTSQANLDGDVLTVTGSFSGLESDLITVSGSSAHVHEAPAGQAGPIVFNLNVTSSDNRSGTFTGSQTLTQAQRDAYLAGRYYVNIHTVNNPGGEIRGQFVP